MRGEQTKKAGSGAGMAAVNAAATAQLLSYQEPPSTTPNVVLQWRSIGARKNISGYAVSSELFAFLGTDTRTKTRMLQTIAGLTEPSPSSSSSSSIDTQPVTLNGVPLTAPPVNSSWLDVQDAVHLYENLSVLETLVFSAEMRLGTGPSSAAATTGGGGHGHAGSGGPRRSTEVAGYSRHQPAELLAVRLLTEMGLEDIAETRVGDLPAWQRRVTLFATEVIAGRDVLFFDRPTSDLDAQSALAVVTSLQRIARGNRLVAITAATLTFREYAILDRIQLLSKNGAIYYGLGSGALAYFEKLSRTPSPGASISDFLLDLVDEESDIFPGYRGLRDISTLEGISEGLGLAIAQQAKGPLGRANTGSPATAHRGARSTETDDFDEERPGYGHSPGSRRYGTASALGQGPGARGGGAGIGAGRGGSGNGGMSFSYSGAPRGPTWPADAPTAPRRPPGAGAGTSSSAATGTHNGVVGWLSALFLFRGGAERPALSMASLLGGGAWLHRQAQYRAAAAYAGLGACMGGAANCLEASFVCSDNCDCSFDEEDDCPVQPLLLKQFALCLWRGVVVRYRNKDQLYGVWLLAGALVSAGLAVVFRNSRDSLDDKCALLTVLPFALVLLSNLWNEDEYHDRRIFAYERERGYFTWPLLSPLTSLVADVLLHKLLPPVLAAATAYPALGLRDSWAAWFDFLLVLCLVQVAGACFAKAVFSAMATASAFVPVKAAMAAAFLLCTQVLYTGLLVDLSRGGPGKQLSVFYWACNVLYWGELGGRTGSTTSTGAGPVQVSGEELLAALSVDREPRSRALGALCLHALASLLVALGCSLRLHRDWRLNKQQRKRREQDEAAADADAPSPPPHS